MLSKTEQDAIEQIASAVENLRKFGWRVNEHEVTVTSFDRNKETLHVLKLEIRKGLLSANF